MIRLSSRAQLAAAVLLVAVGVVTALVVTGFARSSANADRLWNEARRAFEERRFERTEMLLNQLARLRAPTPMDSLLHAQVALAHGRPDEALADLERVPDGNAMGSQARLQEGQLELRRARARAAEQCYLRALALDPHLVQARRELVYIYGMQLRRRALGEQFKLLSEQTLLNFQDVFTWCLTRGCVWEPAEAANDLKRWVTADPSDRWSRLALADNLRQMHLEGEAEAALRPLSDSDPDARAIRVMIAFDQNDLASAQRILDEGKADSPELARLRGRLAVMNKDGKSALAYFRQANAADPDNRDTLFYLALALRMTGQDQAAKPYFEKARKLDALEVLVKRASAAKARENRQLALELGAACAAVGRIPEARAWYKVAIDRDPLDVEAQKALALLEKDPAGAPKR
ncbi:MAG TPA: tetratricopeptide repeat protein [Isosphaeraceae bacterium]|jgi:tetratricopeptide (TPR) repeat protein|nr:tetratricopeptide repeat protein [Isosphaeraceae bacterium]